MNEVMFYLFYLNSSMHFKAAEKDFFGQFMVNFTIDEKGEVASSKLHQNFTVHASQTSSKFYSPCIYHLALQRFQSTVKHV